jgi:hypothetical protein
LAPQVTSRMLAWLALTAPIIKLGLQINPSRKDAIPS